MLKTSLFMSFSRRTREGDLHSFLPSTRAISNFVGKGLRLLGGT